MCQLLRRFIVIIKYFFQINILIFVVSIKDQQNLVAVLRKMQFIVQRNKKSQVKQKSLLLISINYVYLVGEDLKKKKIQTKFVQAFIILSILNLVFIFKKVNLN